VWGERTQVQKVFIIVEEEKSSIYGKDAKGAPTERAGTLCEEKGVGRRKKVEEGKRRRGSMLLHYKQIFCRR